MIIQAMSIGVRDEENTRLHEVAYPTKMIPNWNAVDSLDFFQDDIMYRVNCLRLADINIRETGVRVHSSGVSTSSALCLHFTRCP